MLPPGHTLGGEYQAEASMKDRRGTSSGPYLVLKN